MDLGWLPGVAIALLAVWASLLVLFWLLRPKDVPVREILRVVPDVLRLLRALIADRAVPLDARLVLIGLVAWIVSPDRPHPRVHPGPRPARRRGRRRGRPALRPPADRARRHPRAVV